MIKLEVEKDQVKAEVPKNTDVGLLGAEMLCGIRAVQKLLTDRGEDKNRCFIKALIVTLIMIEKGDLNDDKCKN